MATESAFTNPSQTGPNLAWSSETVGPSGINWQNNTTTSPGGTDLTWGIVQWSSNEIFDPTVQAPPIYNSLFGESISNVVTPDGQNGVATFDNSGSYVYQLTDIGGKLKDLQLATTENAALDWTFNFQMTETIQEGIFGTYTSSSLGPTSMSNGVTVAFNRPGSPYYNPNLPTMSVFLETPLSTQSGSPGFYTNNNQSSLQYNVAPGPNNNNQALPFFADNQMHQVTIDLNSEVAQMSTWLASLTSLPKVQQAGTSAIENMQNWSLTSDYMGIEAIGSGATLDIQNPEINRNTSQPFSYTDQSSTAVTVSGGLNFQQFQGFVQDGNTYNVTNDPLATANISATSGTPNIVYGNSAALNYTGRNGTIYLNLLNPYPTGTATITDLGGDIVFVGSGSLNYIEEGAGTIILAPPARNTTGTVTIEGRGVSVATTVDCSNITGDTSNIIDQCSNSTVFGGASILNISAYEDLLVLNSGDSTVESNGNDTIFAGSGALVDYNFIGGDQVFLGSGSSSIYGAVTSAGTAPTEINGTSANGALTYFGGENSSDINVENGSATIFGDYGTETINGQGSGNITVVDGITNVGEQIITLTGSGSLNFWGGGNSADITLGSGSADINAGVGNVTISGGSGYEMLDIGSAQAADLIFSGLNQGNVDVYGYSSLNDNAKISNVVGTVFDAIGLTFDLANGSKITFHSVTSDTGMQISPI